MGWNPHNFVNGDFNDTLVRAHADLLVSLGLADLGYKYVNLDDGWQAKTRAPDGTLTYDTKKFPNGIKAVSDYVHSKGLFFGLYSGAASLTYKNLPGSLGHEDTDAETFASWDCDYLKYDYYKENWTSPVPERYIKMGKALNKTGRPMFYSNSGGGFSLPWIWGPTYLNSWRISLDIANKWSSITYIAAVAAEVASFGKPGAWNDLDMLEVGNGGLTFVEEQAHFALWAFVKSNLLLGNDLRKVTNETLSIIGNKEIIAVNQDPLGIPATRLYASSDNHTEIWGCPVVDGYAALLWNKDSTTKTVTANFSLFKLSGTYNVRDLYAHQDLGKFTNSFSASIPSHGVKAIKLTQVSEKFLAQEI